MVNKNPKTDWKQDDTCFFHDVISDKIQTGTISSISKDGQRAYVRQLYSMNTYPHDINTLFDKKGDADAALAEERARHEEIKDARVRKYCNGIKTVEDLVQFGYDYNVSDEYEDYTNRLARKAYAVMAEKLLGLKLEL